VSGNDWQSQQQQAPAAAAAAAACPVINRNSIISVMHLLLLTWQGADIVMCGVSLLATSSV